MAFLFWMVPLTYVYAFSANTVFLLAPVRGELTRRIRFGFFQIVLTLGLLSILGVTMFVVNRWSLQISNGYSHFIPMFIVVSTAVYSVLAYFSFRLTLWAYRRY
jgi:hypothetical protein